MDDFALIWYVATPEADHATFQTDHIYGVHGTVGPYQLGFQESNTTKPATYNGAEFSSNYFAALTVDELDEYDAKKYFTNEIKDYGFWVPPHTLFDPDSLYRAGTPYSGNLVMIEKFYQLPFQVDIHFGYRNSSWTKEEMDFDKATASFIHGEAGFDTKFEEVFMKEKKTEPIIPNFMGHLIKSGLGQSTWTEE